MVLSLNKIHAKPMPDVARLNELVKLLEHVLKKVDPALKLEGVYGYARHYWPKLSLPGLDEVLWAIRVRNVEQHEGDIEHREGGGNEAAVRRAVFVLFGAIERLVQRLDYTHPDLAEQARGRVSAENLRLASENSHWLPNEGREETAGVSGAKGIERLLRPALTVFLIWLILGLVFGIVGAGVQLATGLHAMHDYLTSDAMIAALADDSDDDLPPVSETKAPVDPSLQVHPEDVYDFMLKEHARMEARWKAGWREIPITESEILVLSRTGYYLPKMSVALMPPDIEIGWQIEILEGRNSNPHSFGSRRRQIMIDYDPFGPPVYQDALGASYKIWRDHLLNKPELFLKSHVMGHTSANYIVKLSWRNMDRRPTRQQQLEAWDKAWDLARAQVKQTRFLLERSFMEEDLGQTILITAPVGEINGIPLKWDMHITVVPLIHPTERWMVSGRPQVEIHSPALQLAAGPDAKDSLWSKRIDSYFERIVFDQVHPYIGQRQGYLKITAPKALGPFTCRVVIRHY